MPTSSSQEICKKPDGITCNNCTRRHHQSLHNKGTSTTEPRQGPENASASSASQEACNYNFIGKRSVFACPNGEDKAQRRKSNRSISYTR